VIGVRLLLLPDCPIRAKPGTFGGPQRSTDTMVRLRDESFDLAISTHDEPQEGRLNAPHRNDASETTEASAQRVEPREVEPIEPIGALPGESSVIQRPKASIGLELPQRSLDRGRSQVG